jgi:hypothetical protein
MTGPPSSIPGRSPTTRGRPAQARRRPWRRRSVPHRWRRNGSSAPWQATLPPPRCPASPGAGTRAVSRDRGLGDASDKGARTGSYRPNSRTENVDARTPHVPPSRRARHASLPLCAISERLCPTARDARSGRAAGARRRATNARVAPASAKRQQRRLRYRVHAAREREPARLEWSNVRAGHMVLCDGYCPGRNVDSAASRGMKLLCEGPGGVRRRA